MVLRYYQKAILQIPLKKDASILLNIDIPCSPTNVCANLVLYIDKYTLIELSLNQTWLKRICCVANFMLYSVNLPAMCVHIHVIIFHVN